MKTWKDITLGQFNKIQEFLRNPDDYTMLNIIDILYGEDSANLPIAVYMQKYAHSLDFLTDTIPTTELKKFYTINDTVYDSNSDITQMTTAQFVDYQNYSKKKEPLVNELLSVFFIPKGHSYNDGKYDLQKVKNDLLELDMPTIHSFAFFFEKQYILLLDVFLTCLAMETKTMDISETKKAEILKYINQIDLSSLDSFHTFLHSAKKPTIPYPRH